MNGINIALIATLLMTFATFSAPFSAARDNIGEQHVVKVRVKQTGGTRGAGLWVEMLRDQTVIARKRTHQHGQLERFHIPHDDHASSVVWLRVTGFAGEPHLEKLELTDAAQIDIVIDLDK